MTAQVVAQFEAEYFPVLERYAEELRHHYPRFSAKVGSGSLPTTQGHFVFLDIWRENSANPEPNCISLEIGIRTLSNQPVLSMLDVCWGGDGTAPRDSLDCLDKTIPWGAGAVEKINAELPKLKYDLEECLKAWEKAYL